MKRKKSHASHYAAEKSGILVPSVAFSDFNAQDSCSYLAIKQQGLALQDLYIKNELTMHPACSLSKLIKEAAALSDAFLCNESSNISLSRLLNAGQLNRIAAATLPLGISAKAKKYLSDLLVGNLDLLNKERSKAKNTLWELELWQFFKGVDIERVLEEPDIVIAFEGVKIGIACKKIYSEKNIAKTLSNAVSQIEVDFSMGIIAINLDDLVPESCFFKTNSREDRLLELSIINASFIKRNDRHFRKYLESGRAMAVIVSTSVVSDVVNGSPRFNNVRHSLMWTMPGLSLDKLHQINNLERALNRAYF
jgi:hypothetical protein